MRDIALAVPVVAPILLWSWLTRQATLPGWGEVSTITSEQMRSIARAAAAAAETFAHLSAAMQDFQRALDNAIGRQ